MAEPEAPAAPAEAPPPEEQQQKDAPARHRGVTKWFNATKGYGFVTPLVEGDDAEETPEEIFVHQSSIQAEGFRSLREGEEVEYEIEEGPDGRTKAINVTGPGGAAPQGAPRRSSFRSPSAAGGAPPGSVPAGAAAAAAAAAGGAPPGGYRGGGGGRGRGPPMPMPPYPYAYAGGFDYYGAYGAGFAAAAAYGYPPRGAPMYAAVRGMRGGGGGRFPGAHGGRFLPVVPGAGGGRGGGRGGVPYVGGVPAGAAGESSGLQVVVHNLPWTTTWHQLKDLFKEWKVERADVVYDSWGKSRGFGTVRFTSKEEADAACEKLNETEYEGRVITVRLDRFA